MDSILSLRDLRMSYGSKEVLRGIDLEVAPGTILGYLGANGAGKTTTVKILIGMLTGWSGAAAVCGLDVATDPLAVKRRIGYVPESAALYEALTPMEYLRFLGALHDQPEAATERRGRELLGLFGLGDELDHRISTFSKGMRQKVLLVAGLIHDPELLFLDEPLSGLDANTAVVVKEVLSRLAAAGKTIFYCSHVMDVVERVCDRIVILDQGRIVADGSFEQLRAGAQGASLEGIFTGLTSHGELAGVADRFLAALELAPRDCDSGAQAEATPPTGED
jgi:ABC-2 type transport system ATP-binding protein